MTIGAEFAGYRIERLLGEGGFASVYLAEDPNPHLQRMIALKVLRQSPATDPSLQERFLREARAAAAINHPNIVPVYGAGEHDGRHYIAMQYVDGPDLGTVVAQRGPMPLGALVPLLTGIASALDAAHSRGLVHRDVKPGNIVLRADLQHAYLTDFGLVKRPEQERALTTAGGFLGTLEYVAPEQIEGRGVGPTTDTYSLACVVFECLAGRSPFHEVEGIGVLTAHLTRPPPRISSFRPDLPPAIDDILMRGMDKDPARRSTCGELAAAVSAAAAPPAAPAPVPGPGASATETRAVATPGPLPGSGGPAVGSSTPSRRGVAGVVAAGIVLVVLVAGAGAFLLLRDTGSEDFPTDSEEALLRQVPSRVRDACERADAEDAALASLSCGAAGDADDVSYQLFEDRRQMDDHYTGRLDQVEVERDSGSCAEFDRVESGYVTTENFRGRVVCYRDQGDSHIVWTMDELRVVGQATRFDRSDGLLYAWWADLLDVEDDDLEEVDVDQENLDTLFARIPSAIRSTCEAVEPAAPALAEVECSPDDADFAIYALFETVADLNADYRAERDRSEVAPNTGSCDEDIEAENSYSSGGEPGAGRLLCYRDDGAWIIWTNTELLILAVAFRADEADLTLYNWWVDAGPLSEG